MKQGLAMAEFGSSNSSYPKYQMKLTHDNKFENEKLLLILDAMHASKNAGLTPVSLVLTTQVI